MANVSDDLSNRLNTALGSTSAGQEHVTVLNSAKTATTAVASAAQAISSQTQTTLTDNTGGVVSTTLAAGITDVVAKNAIASLAAELALVKADMALQVALTNALRAALITNGIIKGSA
jgi:hypothetical protein